jgi:hypothetical protein
MCRISPLCFPGIALFFRLHSLGVFVMGLESGKQLGIYVVSQVVAGVAAAYVYQATTGAD